MAIFVYVYALQAKAQFETMVSIELCKATHWPEISLLDKVQYRLDSAFFGKSSLEDESIRKWRVLSSQNALTPRTSGSSGPGFNLMAQLLQENTNTPTF